MLTKYYRVSLVAILLLTAVLISSLQADAAVPPLHLEMKPSEATTSNSVGLDIQSSKKIKINYSTNRFGMLMVKNTVTGEKNVIAHLHNGTHSDEKQLSAGDWEIYVERVDTSSTISVDIYVEGVNAI